MALRHAARWGVLLSVALAASAIQPRPAGTQQELPPEFVESDWPCHARYRAKLVAATFWTGPKPDEGASQWRDDSQVRKLAETLGSPETTTRLAVERIDAFARELANGKDKDRRLTLLFYALLDEINTYRRFVHDGIYQFMGRRRLAAEALATTEAEYHSVPHDGSKASKAKRKQLEQRRFWQSRVFDNAEDEARFLCKRLTSLEGKLGAMARAIAGHLGS